MKKPSPAERERALENAEAARRDVVRSMAGYLEDAIKALSVAVENGDLPTIERLAHDLSGEAQQFDAPVVASLAKAARSLIDAPPSSRKLPALKATAGAVKAAYVERLRPESERASELHAQMRCLQLALGVDTQELLNLV
jgi:predicted NAD/FAD-binding protein